MGDRKETGSPIEPTENDEQKAEQPEGQVSLTEEQISSSALRRRSFLKATGVAVSTSVVAATTTACLSDPCDYDIGDPGGAASDRDPYDPVRSDNDRGDRCDAD